jgi:hypothetical protein
MLKGRKIFDLPDATGFKAPKFIYEKDQRIFSLDASRLEKRRHALKRTEFIYGDTMQLCSYAAMLPS